MNRHYTALYLERFQIEFNCYEHREITFSAIEKLWKNQKSCDLILIANGTEFYCHRIFLICLSKYFACIDKYKSEFDENEKIIKLQLPYIDSNSMNLILEYIYTGHITATSNCLIRLIYTVDYFLIEAMLESISKILKNYLSVENVIDFYQLTNQINHQLLLSVIMQFIIRNVYKLYKDNKLSRLPINIIIQIIRDRRLIIRDKSVLYFGNHFKTCLEEIISSWINFDFFNRKYYETILVECLESQFLGSWYDKLKLETYRYIEPISRAYFLNSNPFGQHPPSLVSPPYNFRCLGRNIKRTFIDNPPHKWFIKKIIIYVIPDWNHVAAVADIQIDYKHYWSNEIQSFKAVIDNYSAYIKEEINLDDDERILKLEINHGWMIYGIKFYSNKNNVFGVYGSCTGEMTKIDFQSDYSNAMYLHGFAFISIYSKDWHAINWLTVYGSMIDKDIYYQDFQVAFEIDNDNHTEEDELSDSLIENNDNQIGPEEILQEIMFPLPHTIEDLFYQWRRYMRIMRLSAIRRNNSILSFRERDSLHFSTNSSMFAPNISASDITENDHIIDI